MTETFGDTSSVDCPKCGKPIRNLWDYGSGLESGMEIECPHCEQTVKVTSVYTVHEVVLEG